MTFDFSNYSSQDWQRLQELKHELNRTRLSKFYRTARGKEHYAELNENWRNITRSDFPAMTDKFYNELNYATVERIRTNGNFIDNKFNESHLTTQEKMDVLTPYKNQSNQTLTAMEFAFDSGLSMDQVKKLDNPKFSDAQMYQLIMSHDKGPDAFNALFKAIEADPTMSPEQMKELRLNFERKDPEKHNLEPDKPKDIIEQIRKPSLESMIGNASSRVADQAPTVKAPVREDNRSI